MTVPTASDDDRELLARIALRQCGEWCRRKAGRRWQQWSDPDWEQVAVVAALRVVGQFRPGKPGGTPHRNFVAGCCRIAMSDLTRTARRRAAAGYDEAALRVPLDPDAADPRACEPWAEASINEEWRS